jgi:hypothetical protein
MGRVIIFCITLLYSLGQCTAQDESGWQNKFYGGVGVQLTQAMLSGPALAGQAKINYHSAGLALRYGRNKAQRSNIRKFDELSISGDWIEINASVVIPLSTEPSQRLEGLKIGLGLGISTTTSVYTEVFEALPPYEDYLYEESYRDVRQKFSTFSLGYQLYPHKNIELGLGIIGFHIWDKMDVPLPIVITPFKARSPLGLYAELSYIL